jgi:hypothetical protein
VPINSTLGTSTLGQLGVLVGLLAREHIVIELLEVAEEEERKRTPRRPCFRHAAAKVKRHARYARVRAAREAGKELQRGNESSRRSSGRSRRVHVHAHGKPKKARGHQRPSEAMRGHQTPSDAIRRNQTQSACPEHCVLLFCM